MDIDLILEPDRTPAELAELAQLAEAPEFEGRVETRQKQQVDLPRLC